MLFNINFYLQFVLIFNYLLKRNKNIILILYRNENKLDETGAHSRTKIPQRRHSLSCIGGTAKGSKLTIFIYFLFVFIYIFNCGTM